MNFSLNPFELCGTKAEFRTNVLILLSLIDLYVTEAKLNDIIFLLNLSKKNSKTEQVNYKTLKIHNFVYTYATD